MSRYGYTNEGGGRVSADALCTHALTHPPPPHNDIGGLGAVVLTGKAGVSKWLALPIDTLHQAFEKSNAKSDSRARCCYWLLSPHFLPLPLSLSFTGSSQSHHNCNWYTLLVTTMRYEGLPLLRACSVQIVRVLYNVSILVLRGENAIHCFF